MGRRSSGDEDDFLGRRESGIDREEGMGISNGMAQFRGLRSARADQRTIVKTMAPFYCRWISSTKHADSGIQRFAITYSEALDVDIGRSEVAPVDLGDARTRVLIVAN